VLPVERHVTEPAGLTGLSECGPSVPFVPGLFISTAADDSPMTGQRDDWVTTVSNKQTKQTSAQLILK